MRHLGNDIRYAGRALAKTPGTTAVAVLTIALGIAATTTVFSLISALLLRPLPVAEPDRLVTVNESRQGAVRKNMGYSSFSFARYEEYRDASREVFAGLAGHGYDEASLRTEGPAEVVNVVGSTASYFDVLGLRPALGAFFSSRADRDRVPEAVISHGLWSTRFGAEPGVIGRTVHLDGRAYTVTGVAPADFTGIVVGIPVDVWLPADPGDGTRWSGTDLMLFGRLRDGMEPEQARAALEVVSRRVPLEDANTEVLSVDVPPLTAVPHAERTSLIAFMAMLFATAVLVLVISSTNVGGMLLARAAGRRREVAVRLAIGARRGRVVQQLLVESVLLFLLGAVAGVALTFWLTSAASAFQPPVPMRLGFQFGVDLGVLSFACAAALLSGLAFGLAPALQATRSDVVPALKDGDRAASGHRTRLRSGFVVAQVALTLVLLVTAGLFVRTMRSVLAVDLGFDPAGVVAGVVDLGPHGYDDERATALQADLLERVRGIPGVEGAVLARFAPMGGNSWSASVRDAGAGGDGEARSVNLSIVGTGYFEMLRIPLAAGRTFESGDRAGAAPVAVVNRTLAERMWPGTSPLGRRLVWNGQEVEVVGVARDGKYESHTEDPRSMLFVPLEQNPEVAVTVLARSTAGGPATVAAIQRELTALDAAVALQRAAPLEHTMGLHVFPQRIAAWMIGSFGLAGLLLAAIGMYGLLAFQVASRTRELGIRIALGAGAGEVIRLVMRSSLRLTAVGVGVGLAAALGVTRLVESFLFGVSSADPITFLGVPLLLLAVSLAASYVPVRHATRVDPMVALRAE